MRNEGTEERQTDLTAMGVTTEIEVYAMGVASASNSGVCTRRILKPSDGDIGQGPGRSSQP